MFGLNYTYRQTLHVRNVKAFIVLFLENTYVNIVRHPAVTDSK